MISRRHAIIAAISSLIGGESTIGAWAKKSSSVSRFDTDKDGAVDLAEAKKAAGDLFNKLDADKDGTLDIKELQGRLSHKEFAAADPDHDKSVTKDEYLAVVEQRFKAADTDNDGTLSEAEFSTPAGHALVRLLG